MGTGFAVFIFFCCLSEERPLPHQTAKIIKPLQAIHRRACAREGLGTPKVSDDVGALDFGETPGCSAGSSESPWHSLSWPDLTAPFAPDVDPGTPS